MKSYGSGFMKSSAGTGKSTRNGSNNITRNIAMRIKKNSLRAKDDTDTVRRGFKQRKNIILVKM
jgi:hypothetical protein